MNDQKVVIPLIVTIVLSLTMWVGVIVGFTYFLAFLVQKFLL